MYRVYVQDLNGKPMDPTKRFAKVRRMLRDGTAIVVNRKPFTIRLAYETATHEVGTYVGGTDGGRKNIGNAVINIKESKCVYTDHVETRNAEIPKLMEKRKQHRQASRAGERQRRKRRAKKNQTISTKLDNGRLLSGTEEPIPVKDIINQEARFQNRVRPKNWLTPTVNQLVQTHLNHVDQICTLLPITQWVLEINRFSFMRMEDGSIRGVDFQNGRMKGYKSVEDYVFALQDGKCACCGEPIMDIHHIVPRHKGGSDGPDNRIGLCKKCHAMHHEGKIDIEKVGAEQKYGALSVLNQAIPYIYDGLVNRFGEENVTICFGYETEARRKKLGLKKDHHLDAVAIASMATKAKTISMQEQHFEVYQFRRHNRALIKSQTERTYKEKTVDENGDIRYVTVAKNRKARFEQSGDSLDTWYEKMVKTYGEKEAQKMRSQLIVKPSTRKYNRKNRIMAGSVFSYKGLTFILGGQLTKGQYFYPLGMPKMRIRATDCKILKRGGLVYA